MGSRVDGQCPTFQFVRPVLEAAQVPPESVDLNTPPPASRRKAWTPSRDRWPRLRRTGSTAPCWLRPKSHRSRDLNTRRPRPGVDRGGSHGIDGHRLDYQGLAFARENESPSAAGVDGFENAAGFIPAYGVVGVVGSIARAKA